jgi:hypothetical protein
MTISGEIYVHLWRCDSYRIFLGFVRCSQPIGCREFACLRSRARSAIRSTRVRTAQGTAVPKDADNRHCASMVDHCRVLGGFSQPRGSFGPQQPLTTPPLSGIPSNWKCPGSVSLLDGARKESPSQTRTPLPMPYPIGPAGRRGRGLMGRRKWGEPWSKPVEYPYFWWYN